MLGSFRYSVAEGQHLAKAEEDEDEDVEVVEV